VAWRRAGGPASEREMPRAAVSTSGASNEASSEPACTTMDTAATTAPEWIAHRSPDGQAVERHLSLADGDLAAPYLRQDRPEQRRVGDGLGGEPLEWPSQHRLLDVVRSEGQQHEPCTTGRQREPQPHLGVHPHRRPSREPLGEDKLGTLTHAQLDHLVSDLVKVLHERHRGVTQRHAPWREHANLIEPQPNSIQTVVPALEGPPCHELGDHAVGGAQRQPGPPRDRGQREQACVRPEGAEDVEDLARRRGRGQPRGGHHLTVLAPAAGCTSGRRR